MVIKNVSLIGVNGDLGPIMLQGLLDVGEFTLTALKRHSSRSVPSKDPAVRVLEVDDDFSLSSLTNALQGQDAVIVVFRVSDLEQHLRIADAALAAGVQRFIPADFGSCDSSSAYVQELMPLFLRKVRVREHLQNLAAANPGFTWTSLVSGHFFDWGLEKDFLHCNLRSHTMDMLDDGTHRTSMTTLPRIVEAVVRILRCAGSGNDATRNRMLFFQSFCVSQLDVLAALEKATGAKWTVNKLKSDDYIREMKVLADGGDHDGTENLVFAVGAIDGDWEKREGFAMDVLGFENEDLQDVVNAVVKRNS